MKLKMKYMISKNGKRKLNEKIQNIKQNIKHMIFNNMKQDISVKVFMLVKLIYTKLRQIKLIY